MQFRDRIETYLALQAKNESERKAKAALLSLYDKGLIEFKWDDNGELLIRSTDKGRKQPSLSPSASTATTH
jgi:hypothetical protein